MNNLLLIVGKAKAGKSTLANFIEGNSKIQNLHTEIKRFSLAQRLKEIVVELFSVDKRILNTDFDKEKLTMVRSANFPVPIESKNEYLSHREILQFVGTDIIRKIDEYAWVNALNFSLKNYFKNKISTNSLVIIDDVRFPNEIEGLKSSSLFDRTYIVRLTRNTSNLQHESETSLDNYPFNEEEYYLEIDNSDISKDMKNTIVWNWLIENKGIQ